MVKRVVFKEFLKIEVKLGCEGTKLKSLTRNHNRLIAFLGIILACWSVATPIGSSADDNYHLSSIWCNSAENCQETNEGFLVPNVIAGSPTFCYIIWTDRNVNAYKKSAKCSNDTLSSSEKVPTKWLNQIEKMYPNLFYKISSTQVGEDVQESVLRIRLIWLLFFLTNFLVWIKFTKSSNEIPSALLLLGSPLLFFLIPSTNPSSPVLTSAIFVPLILRLIKTEKERVRRIFLFILLTVDSLIAIGSRADAILPLTASTIIFLVLNRKSLKDFGRIFLLYALVLITSLFTFGNLSSTIRFSRSGTSSGGSPKLFDLDLLVSNMMDLPSYIAGFWGFDWGLGWKFEPWIPSVIPFTLFVLFLWHVAKFLRAHPELKSITFLSSTFVAILVLYFHQVSNVNVGNMIQPRYMFPLFLGICVVLLDSRSDNAKSERLFHPFVLYFAATLGVAVFYLQILRVVNGLDGDVTLSRDQNSWWWQNTFVSPRLVILCYLVSVIGYVYSSIRFGNRIYGVRQQKRMIGTLISIYVSQVRNTILAYLKRSSKRFYVLDRLAILIIAIYVFTILINLKFRTSIPITAAILSPHDDQLGIELASNLLAGDWLGVWNNRTLAKPPGYSLYLSMAHFIPIQLAVLNQIIYIILVGVVLVLAQRFFACSDLVKKIATYITFVYLIFQPILFHPEANRIYRSSLPIMMLTLVFALLLLKIFERLNHPINFLKMELKDKIKVYSLFGLLSFTYAMMVLFRYESFWIVICSAPLIILMILLKFAGVRKVKGEFWGYIKFLIPIPIFVVVFYFSPIYAVQESNQVRYGVPITENYFQGSFPEAINLWSSINVGRDPRPYVIVSSDQRNAVYEISSTAALLKPYLEDRESGWHAPACAKLNLCDNVGAWFTWQIRDAAVQTGTVYSERTFQNFFQTIATDIKSACDRKYFECLPKSNLAGSKPLQEIPKKQLIEFTLRNFQVLLPLNFKYDETFSKTDNLGAPEQVVALTHQVANYPISTAYTEAGLASASKQFNTASKIYSVINWLAFIFALLGIALRWKRQIPLELKLVLVFLGLGVTSQLIGAGIAHITFGTLPAPLYILSAYPLLHVFNLLGVISMLNFLQTKTLKMKHTN
jgi:hypothetical protein